MEAIRYQAGEVYDALVETAASADEPQGKSEAESLANHLKEYKFVTPLIFWHDLFLKVNYINKELQSENVDLEAGVASFEKLLTWLKNYRNEGFNHVLISASELAGNLEIPSESRVFPTKSL